MPKTSLYVLAVENFLCSRAHRVMNGGWERYIGTHQTALTAASVSKSCATRQSRSNSSLLQTYVVREYLDHPSADSMPDVSLPQLSCFAEKSVRQGLQHDSDSPYEPTAPFPLQCRCGSEIRLHKTQYEWRVSRDTILNIGFCDKWLELCKAIPVGVRASIMCVQMR